MLHYAIEGTQPTVLLVLQCIINTPATVGLIRINFRASPDNDDSGKSTLITRSKVGEEQLQRQNTGSSEANRLSEQKKHDKAIKAKDLAIKAKSGFGTSLILIGLFIKPFLEAYFGTENGMIASILSNHFFLAVAITCVVVGFMLSFYFAKELKDDGDQKLLGIKLLGPLTFLFRHLGPPLIYLFWAPVITNWYPTLKLILASLYFTIFGLLFVAFTGAWVLEVYRNSELNDKSLPILISLLALSVSTPMLIFSVHSIHPIVKLSLQITMSSTLLFVMFWFWYKLLFARDSRQYASVDTMVISLALIFFFGPTLVLAAISAKEELIPLQSPFFALQLILTSGKLLKSIVASSKFSPPLHFTIIFLPNVKGWCLVQHALSGKEPQKLLSSQDIPYESKSNTQ
ncbi:hypothetical protein TrLO_g9481 [Triparma laevis f. longispina]|uniref:Uncharacterized protein n=1 Tax=Triparma laevis f. longispina TaxID=1714387 RepID=A0A9W7AVN0_9STRA|nr:hypothetical protein TrLO_g9481 [Triparma laevis f. longispina]